MECSCARDLLETIQWDHIATRKPLDYQISKPCSRIKSVRSINPRGESPHNLCVLCTGRGRKPHTKEHTRQVIKVILRAARGVWFGYDPSVVQEAITCCRVDVK
jgi:hypothetical protein